MKTILPAEALYRLGVVVKDYKSSIRSFSEFFGINRWKIRRLDERRLSNATVGGKPAGHSFISAIGSAKGVALELVEPVSGDTVFAEFLQRRGEGMHHLTTNICSPENFQQARAELEKIGVGVAQSGTIDGVMDYHLLDTRQLLAGPLIEVICPHTDSVSRSPEPDEIVNFDESVTSWNRLPIEKTYHVCIVTKHRRDEVRSALEKLLGIDQWFDFGNESGVNAMDTTYYGRACKSAFNLSLGRRNTLCIEVVEMRYGESLYQEMLEQQGEGLHHMMTTICSMEKFAEVRPWLEWEKIPVIQDGRVEDFCYYCYLDTRSKLAGITVEVLAPASKEWLKGREDTGAILIGPA
jgi:methylmalonyl-CoA/ethylmalonyl-CoA epimerase